MTKSNHTHLEHAEKALAIIKEIEKEGYNASTVLVIALYIANDSQFSASKLLN
ncbi:MAG: hypothetical protein KGV51_04745 [Moraxellaceae bacterium]|nr:hypothetical protein [Moraxellaceae bacterium]